tara:strand:+ start:14312 stop:14917 length:606 start_codon:yes stop_codon:yes gene_type:complete
MKKVFFLYSLLSLIQPVFSENINPEILIDLKAQEMVAVIVSNQDLYSTDPEAFKDKIKDIFEPLVDFRRVAASVMGKKLYLEASPEQRKLFIEVFKKSLLDTYTDTLAQWGDQTIVTMFSEKQTFERIEDINQSLKTENNSYPITYKVRQSKGEWKIINIIVNGVNLGLTFRSQFRALAEEYKGDINLVIENWSGDAGITY